MSNIKEFRHSEILYRLLSYHIDGKLRFLEAFLHRLSIDTRGWSFSVKDIHISREEWLEGRPIDVLVVCKNHALIIENKCRNAGDGVGQLHDYIEAVKRNYLIEDNNLTCLYLRRIDSLEGPSGESTVDGEHANLVMISSYREQVVPWLKDVVLKNLPYGSGVMVSSLMAYIDTLEAWSGERTRIIGDGERMVAAFRSAFGCIGDNTYEICKEEINRIEVEESGLLDEALAALKMVKRTLWETNPLLDSYELAEEMKWMLKNNAYPFGRTAMKSRLDLGTMFDYGSIKRGGSVVMAERKTILPDGRIITVRLHLNCCYVATLDKEKMFTVLYGGVIGPVANLPAFDQIMARLASYGFKPFGRPEEGVGFFFTAGNEILQAFHFEGTGRERIWNIAKIFAQNAKIYSETLLEFGYKPQ